MSTSSNTDEFIEWKRSVRMARYTNLLAIVGAQNEDRICCLEPICVPQKTSEEQEVIKFDTVGVLLDFAFTYGTSFLLQKLPLPCEDGNFWKSECKIKDLLFDGETILGCQPTFDLLTENLVREIDEDIIVLVDGSQGDIAEKSIQSGDFEEVAGLFAPALGNAANIETGLLYSFIGGGNLQIIDLKSRSLVELVALYTNDGSDLSYNAASINPDDGFLYCYDYGSDQLHRVDINPASPNYGEVFFVAGAYTGIQGNGTSMAINPIDLKYYILGGGGRVYEIDPSGVDLSATLVYDSASGGNAATFDDSGTLYLGTDDGDAFDEGQVWAIPNFPATGAEFTLVAEWDPGVNSLSYYKYRRVDSQCFREVFLTNPITNEKVFIGYFNEDNTPRNPTGLVVPC